jgi:hypothetical protein
MWAEGAVMSESDRGAKPWRTSAGCSDGACVEVSRAWDGDVLMRNNQRPDKILRVTADEWSGFLRGVARGDFD